MSVKGSNPRTKISNRELVTVRTINASLELVWKAWTNPTHLKEWWGPRGFSNTFEKFDFKPKGEWHFIMNGPDGKDFYNECVFTEIVEHEKIVFEHLKPAHKFQVTVTLAEQKGKTKVTFRMLHDTAKECEEVKKFAVVKNEENFDRMEEELAAMQTPGGPFAISNTLDAPRDLVWQVWTDRKHLKHWWGPKGFTVSFCKMDLRPGGMFHYCLKGPDGSDMWGKFIFRDIVKPNRLVFVSSFSDEKGGITRHPMSPDWPGEMLSTVTFDKQNDKTQVTVKWHPINATEAEKKVFDKGRTSMRQGWSGTFSQLSAYLVNTLKGEKS